jgi:hypothetical protein
MDNIISGERLQNLCDIYCGFQEDFDFNPIIKKQNNKQCDIRKITEVWDNPTYIFCYSHRVKDFMNILHLIKNRFVLVSHNSDENITEKYISLLDNDKLIKMFSQNILIKHPKLNFLPIGIANSMWSHGNLHILCDVMNSDIKKTRDVYFYFSTQTNIEKRNPCKNILEKKGLLFGKSTGYKNYLQDLMSHKYAICPEGNGADSHRIWECIYLGVIPILIKNDFSDNLQDYQCIILNNWEDFNIENFKRNVGGNFNNDKVSLSHYRNFIKEEIFDIVIAVGTNDYKTIENQITFTKKNVIGYRDIYLIKNIDNNMIIDGCINIDESTCFPFTKKSISLIHGTNDRNGWYFQQLLKLYAFMIPGILDKYLVIDADTYFLRSTYFIKNGKCLYNQGTENHTPYFSHMQKLDHRLKRVYPDISGITHHMMFEKRFITKLFSMIETNHNKKFWEVFLEKVDTAHILGSGASEYEIYFNYMLIFNSEHIETRKLTWKNVSTFSILKDYDYISWHWYSR